MNFQKGNFFGKRRLFSFRKKRRFFFAFCISRYICVYIYIIAYIYISCILEEYVYVCIYIICICILGIWEYVIGLIYNQNFWMSCCNIQTCWLIVDYSKPRKRWSKIKLELTLGSDLLFCIFSELAISWNEHLTNRHILSPPF